MSKAKEIASGFTNLLKSKAGLTTEEENKLFSTRALICQACEFGKDRTRCGKCGCILVAKTKSLHSSCPINLW